MELSKPQSVSLDSKSIQVEIDGARSYCDFVQVEWPSTKPVIWFEAPECKGDLWFVTTGAKSPADVDRKIAAVLSQTFFLSCLRNRLLDLGQKHFNISQSLPAYAWISKADWPGRLTKVKTLRILPTDSAQKAIERCTEEVWDLWRDDSLILHGFPFTVELCLNILYVFGHLFSKVGLKNPKDQCGTFLLYKFRKWDRFYEKLKNDLYTMMNSRELNKLAISSTSPKSSFFASKFYIYCQYMHCIHVKQQVLNLLDQIEKQPNCVKRPPPKHQDFGGEECDYTCSNHISREVVESKSLGGKHPVTGNKLKYELEHLSLCVNQVFVECSLSKGIVWLFPESPCQAHEIGRKSFKYTSFNAVEISKFCKQELLLSHLKLCKMLKCYIQMNDATIRQDSCLSCDASSIVTTLRKYPWSKVELKVKLLDFGIEVWMHLEDHVQYRISTLQRIIAALNGTLKNENLELRGFPMLSEFNVSVVFLISQLFEKMGYYHTPSGRNAIFFYNFGHFSKNVKVSLEVALAHSDVVSSLVPIRRLLCGIFDEKTRNSNNISLKKHCLHMLRILSVQKQAKEES